MPANRFFHLKHPRGFDDDHFAAFRSGCEVWRADVEASLRHWRLWSGRDAQGRYEWYPPELSEDRLVATLGVGGVIYKELEDEFPRRLYAYLPPVFRLDLELGHALTSPNFSWRPLHSPEERETLRRILAPG